MNYIKYAFFTLIFSTTVSSYAEITLTKPMVKTLMDEIHLAFDTRDTDTDPYAFSKNGRVFIRDSSNQNEIIEFTQNDYLNIFRANWHLPNVKYELERACSKILMSKLHNKATVIECLMETVERDGAIIETKIIKTYTVELVDETPKITKLFGSIGVAEF
jgi:hypothetical protein